MVDTRVVRAEEYVVDAQREAGQDEDARRHHALRAPLQVLGRKSDEGESDALCGPVDAMRRCRAARRRKEVFLRSTRSDPDVRARRWESSDVRWRARQVSTVRCSAPHHLNFHRRSSCKSSHKVSLRPSPAEESVSQLRYYENDTREGLKTDAKYDTHRLLSQASA